MEHELVSRDSRNRTRHTEVNYIPFELKFLLPPLRKSRVIVERNNFGKIVQLRLP